ncbi:IS3 family transposase [Limnoglobus roseus]|uniref:IS3 family transposase n=1 Tax=Limnoglobus roseus TaxID=2598579 RepID=A0A5C1AP77_9BACT|nr:transposase [Limnoglobus roseus]QEL19943.1 IS3 family transposase [Limnoglobus roseus]
MPRPRSTSAAEFKLAAVKVMTEQKRAVAEAARRLDVGEDLLREWRKAFLARGADAFPGTATRPRPRRSFAASGPRSPAPGPSATC